MKKIHNKLVLFVLSLTMSPLIAQTQAPPPPPGQSQNQDDNQLGGSAPLGEGIFYLTGLALVYGGIKQKRANRQKKERGKKQ